MTTAVEKAPRVTQPQAGRIAFDLFGVECDALPLPSERDQNFFLRGPSGEQFVLKIANSEEESEILDLQNHFIQFLVDRCPALRGHES